MVNAFCDFELRSDPSAPYQPLAIVWDDCSGALYCAILDIMQELVSDLKAAQLAGPSWLHLCFGSFSIPGLWGPGHRPHDTCLFTTFAIFDNVSQHIGGWPVLGDLACIPRADWWLLTGEFWSSLRQTSLCG